MAYRITTASEHIPDEPILYCTRDNVLAWLNRVNVGDDTTATQPLANLGTTGERDDLIDVALEPAKLRVDGIAGRDFAYHEDVDIAINGNGLDRLDLSMFGFIPLLELTDLVIDDSTVDTDDYEYNRRGWIQYNGGVVSELTIFKYQFTGGFFPKGSTNVEAKITWGYETPPADIVKASAFFVIGDLLAFLEAVSGNTDEPIGEGDVSLRLGDVSITQRQSSKYGSLRKYVETQATNICKKYRPRLRMGYVTPEKRVPIGAQRWA